MAVDYSGVTETPGTLVSPDAASMAMSRYALARKHAHGRRVLEIACGSGQGLGFVGSAATLMVGGDITPVLLARARAHYQGQVPLVRFDAHALPFRSAAFDLIQLHEAIYYMADPRRVFAECRRLLQPGGELIVTSINPSWPDFNPSPHAASYLTAEQLEAVLRSVFDVVELRFGFRVVRGGLRSRMLSAAKRAAIRLNLIPKTMQGKTLLKRVAFGRLTAVPEVLTEGFARAEDPIDAPIAASRDYRIIYAIAR